MAFQFNDENASENYELMKKLRLQKTVNGKVVDTISTFDTENELSRWYFETVEQWKKEGYDAIAEINFETNSSDELEGCMYLPDIGMTYFIKY